MQMVRMEIRNRKMYPLKDIEFSRIGNFGAEWIFVYLALNIFSLQAHSRGIIRILFRTIA